MQPRTLYIRATGAPLPNCDARDLERTTDDVGTCPYFWKCLKGQTDTLARRELVDPLNSQHLYIPTPHTDLHPIQRFLGPCRNQSPSLCELKTEPCRWGHGFGY